MLPSDSGTFDAQKHSSQMPGFVVGRLAVSTENMRLASTLYRYSYAVADETRATCSGTASLAFRIRPSFFSRSVRSDLDCPWIAQTGFPACARVSERDGNHAGRAFRLIRNGQVGYSHQGNPYLSKILGIPKCHTISIFSPAMRICHKKQDRCANLKSEEVW